MGTYVIIWDNTHESLCFDKADLVFQEETLCLHVKPAAVRSSMILN